MGDSQHFVKDPDSTLDYQVDWTSWLGEDTVTGSVWTVPDGLTQTRDENTATTARVFLAGGVHGDDYKVTNRITTAAGRTDDRTLHIQVRHR